jgi:sec-independent protein translocase protein TatC
MDQFSKEEKEMSFLDHLEELRWHIIRSLLVVAGFMVLAFINRGFIFNTLILKPKNPEFFTNRLFARAGEWLGGVFSTDLGSLAINNTPLEIQNIEMAGQFMAHIKVSVIAGLILASPYILWEIWRFIRPALYTRERQHARGAVFFTSLLFLLGVLFGYYLIAPLSIHFLGSYNVSEEVGNAIKLNSYISTITSVVFATGVIFELPMVVLFLSKAGLIGPQFMRKYRRHAYILLLVISAVITPPDVFSQILVCIPLAILYELSVFLSLSVERKRLKDTQ